MSIIEATHYLLENFTSQFSGDLEMYPSRAELLKEITINVPNTREGSSGKGILNGHLDKCLNEKNFNSGEHLAYCKYKKFGDYWKCTPKTDYTYSKLSSCRRVLAPGVIATPNMSRRGLDSYMIEKVAILEEAEQLNHFDNQKFESLSDSTNVGRRPSDKRKQCVLIEKIKAAHQIVLNTNHYGLNESHSFAVSETMGSTMFKISRLTIEWSEKKEKFLELHQF
uniref:Uncharacterized protein n=1 Tax=Glossina pallidipes TaxID=7398 RepID=A0A1A9ZJA9_GLOPL